MVPWVVVLSIVGIDVVIVVGTTVVESVTVVGVVAIAVVVSTTGLHWYIIFNFMTSFYIIFDRSNVYKPIIGLLILLNFDF
jgi:hypothetical protein